MSPAAGQGASESAPGAVLSAGTGAGAALGLSGELDRDGAERLRAQLDDALQPGAVVTLDLARVTHVSQAALAVLVQAHRRLRDSGGALLLTSVSEPVVRVLRISGLHRIFTVLDGPAPAGTEPQAGAPQQAAGA